jgi:hypothetical protein
VEADKRIDLTNEIHLGPNPLAWSIARMALYSTLSNAFSKSILRIIIGFLERWQICKYSKAHAIQSSINLEYLEPISFSNQNISILLRNILPTKGFP